MSEEMRYIEGLPPERKDLPKHPITKLWKRFILQSRLRNSMLVVFIKRDGTKKQVVVSQKDLLKFKPSSMVIEKGGLEKFLQKKSDETKT